MTKTLLIMLISTAIIIGGLAYVTLMTYPTSARTVMPFQLSKDKVHYSQLPKFVNVGPLGKKILIEVVGKTENGNIALPGDVNRVGWYESEYRLGERGSIVFAALDKNPEGAPGVFDGLSTLKKGDIITVTDTSDKDYEYVVDEVGQYEWTPEYKMKIFNLYEKPYLNLIVYGYSFEDSSYHYPQVVVYSHFQESKSN